MAASHPVNTAPHLHLGKRIGTGQLSAVGAQTLSAIALIPSAVC